MIRIKKLIFGNKKDLYDMPEFNKGDLIVLNEFGSRVALALITVVHRPQCLEIPNKDDCIKYSILFDGIHHNRVSESTLSQWRVLTGWVSDDPNSSHI